MPGHLGGVQGMLSNLSALLDTIHTKTQGAQVILVGYPLFFPPNGHTGGCNGITVENQIHLNDAADAVDNQMWSWADSRGVIFQDVRKLFVGHEVCIATGESSINDLQLNINQPLGGETVVHNCPSNRLVATFPSLPLGLEKSSTRHAGTVGWWPRGHPPTVDAYRAEAE